MKSLILSEAVQGGNLRVRAPSNIALIKYWGKKEVQLPMNPSLSLTLSEAFTESEIDYEFEEIIPRKNVHLVFDFEGEDSSKYSARIQNYFDSLLMRYPFLGQLKIILRTRNSFPHSAGIASSASSMASLALALCSLEKKFFNSFLSDEDFFKKASILARLGSGSASRSVYGGVVTWGCIEGQESSDEYATAMTEVHSCFDDYRDSILIVDSKPKSVSSSLGHQIMNNSAYGNVRFNEARKKILALIKVMRSGDLEQFVSIVENEALELHGMMLASNYMLIRPQTISLIEELRAFRKESSIPVCFTLDAGPNLHLLYPAQYSQKIKGFIDQMKPFYENFLHDRVGTGPQIHD